MDITVLPTPTKSQSDKKEYRQLKLGNGLQVLLISDVTGNYSKSDTKNIQDFSSDDDIESDSDVSEADSDEDFGKKSKKFLKNKQAAAALCVGVGSFSDPEDIPGLAHFLEHMVFMGSSAYPNENHFDMFIRRHGGDDNAFTDCERTSFIFEINPCYLREALNIWAQFFISPLMRKGSINREVKAVHSEFKSALVDDHVRGEQIIGKFCKKDHPIGKFLWGNEKSLKKAPAKKGINVYNALKAFHKNYYNAKNMTLAVQSPEDLDTLQKWVVEIFKDVPNNNEASKIDFPASIPYPVSDQCMFQVCNIVSVKQLQEIQLMWFVAPQLKNYRTKPLEYLSWLVGHEGTGSLLSLLKKENLALSLTTEVDDSGLSDSSLYSMFTVEISLTDKGYKEYPKILDYVFQYMHMIRKAGPVERIFKEIQQIEQIEFSYCEEDSPIDYVEDLCENMMLYSPSEVLTGDCLLTEYNEKVIGDVLNEILPHKCLVFRYNNKPLPQNEAKYKKELWFGTKYSIGSIDKEWCDKWKKEEEIDIHPDLGFPLPNPYIATDFNLADSSSKTETSSIKLLSTNYPASSLWFKQDFSFHLPKAFIRMHLINSCSVLSPEHSAYLDLMIEILNHVMAEKVYSAEIASLDYSVTTSSKGGLIIKVSGFNDKLATLLITILDHLVNLTCSINVFEEEKLQQLRDFNNRLISAKKLSKDLRLSILEKLRFPLLEKYSASEHLTRWGLLNFISQFNSQLHVDCLIQGNYTEQQAISIFEKCSDKLGCLFVDNSKIFPERILQLKDEETYVKVKSLSVEDENSMVTVYIQRGPGTIYDSIMMQLLSTLMEEPCFDILRTKKQLGYTVYCQDHSTSGILGLSVNVQTQKSKFTVEEATKDIMQFLRQDFKELLYGWTVEEFQEQVDALITIKTNEDCQLSEEVSRNWDEIVVGDCNFDRLQQEVKYLRNVTFDEIKKFYEEICVVNQRILVVQVEGNYPLSVHCTDDITATITAPILDLTYLTPEQSQANQAHIKSLNDYVDSSYFYPVSFVRDSV